MLLAAHTTVLGQLTAEPAFHTGLVCHGRLEAEGGKKPTWEAPTPATSEVVLLSHATTVVTNAILSEHGARAALITTRGNPMATSLHDAGLIALMDETSQLVGALAASHLSGMVLDACAAPGGSPSPTGHQPLAQIHAEALHEPL